MSSLQSQAGKDKAAMEEDYQKALELIFAYGYGCCMFKHNIYDDQPEAGKDKAAMEEDYQKALELIFAYGYGCCMFKHNIYDDQPEVLEGMPDSSDPLPPKFFANPRCPPVPAATKATTAKVDQSKAAEEPESSPGFCLNILSSFSFPFFFVFFFSKFL